MQSHKHWHIFGNSLKMPLSRADYFFCILDSCLNLKDFWWLGHHQNTLNTVYTALVFLLSPLQLHFIQIAKSELVFSWKHLYKCSSQRSYNAVLMRGDTPETTCQHAVTCFLYCGKSEYFIHFTHVANIFIICSLWVSVSSYRMYRWWWRVYDHMSHPEHPGIAVSHYLF